MAQDDGPKVLDTVIVGGGISGLTVAYRLGDRDILLLEKEDVCGGRTISRKMGEYVYNTGAQVVNGDDSLVAPLADELGIKRTLIAKSKMPIWMKGKLITASSEPAFLWQLPLSLGDKLRLGFRMFNIKRKYGKLSKDLPDLNDPKTIKLNATTLSEFVGASSPDLKALWDTVSLATALVPSDQVAAYHPLSTLIHFMADEYYVEGGTWELTKALWNQTRDKIKVSAEVLEIAQQGDRVQVTYVQNDQTETVQAHHCVVALPAPLVAPIVKDLPSWKAGALSKVDFSPITSAAFLLSKPSEYFLGEGVWRVPTVGCAIVSVTNPTFTFPSEIKERTGQGLLRVYSVGRESEKLMEMSDGEALEALAGELISVLPEVKGNIITSSLKHWIHGGSPWRLGRLQLVPEIQAPTGNVHYCGDYTAGSGMDGAVHSASRVLEELGAGPLFP
ncbi:MAG: FAD-dependent oxidoreductase [Chloroflexi bacterium]|nr:FAD-dependent oxidoreductase [Chloroflexota bacterium]